MMLVSSKTFSLIITVLVLIVSIGYADKCYWTGCQPYHAASRACPAGYYNFTSKPCIVTTNFGGLSTVQCCRVEATEAPHPSTSSPTTGQPSTTTGKPSSTSPGSVGLNECEETRQKSFSFQVALIQVDPEKNKSIHFCGGTIYSESYVLTAAHCLYDQETHQKIPSGHIQAAAGDHNLNKFERTEQILQAEKYFIHEKFNPKDPGRYADIAILKLKWKYIFDENVSSLPLPFDNSDIKGVASVAGWAEKELWSNQGSPVLRKVDVPIISDKDCVPTIKYPESQLCAAGDGTHAFCSGDSGGPLVCKNKNKEKFACGIAAISNNEKNVPNVYTDTAYFRQWIEDTTRQ